MFLLAEAVLRRPLPIQVVDIANRIGLTLIIALAMFAWGVQVFFTSSRPPADAQEYWVTGKQWMWKVQHPGGQQEINELHVPVDQPIRLIMTSQDVIHSFFVPAFRLKHDVLPGTYVTAWFEATQTGEYHLFCAEYCGAEHSGMIGQVIAWIVTVIWGMCQRSTTVEPMRSALRASLNAGWLVGGS